MSYICLPLSSYATAIGQRVHVVFGMLLFLLDYVHKQDCVIDVCLLMFASVLMFSLDLLYTRLSSCMLLEAFNQKVSTT